MLGKMNTITLTVFPFLLEFLFLRSISYSMEYQFWSIWISCTIYDLPQILPQPQPACFCVGEEGVAVILSILLINSQNTGVLSTLL